MKNSYPSSLVAKLEQLLAESQSLDNPQTRVEWLGTVRGLLEAFDPHGHYIMSEGPYSIFCSAAEWYRPQDRTLDDQQIGHSFSAGRAALESILRDRPAPDPPYEQQNQRSERRRKQAAEDIEDSDIPSVFLSYSWEDRQVVNALDQFLRDAGFRVMRDERSFIAGRRIHEEIQRIVTQANCIVVVYSRSSANRPWPAVERQLAEDRRAQEEDTTCRLLYFRVDDTQLPHSESARLAVNAYHFQGEGAFESAAKELARHLMGREGEPSKYDWKAMNKLINPWK